MAFIQNFKQRRLKLEPIKFVPVHAAFKPQVQVKFTRDISGWVSRDRKVKWSAKKDDIVFLDEDSAAEFITKGYAEGELPRKVSDSEAAEWAAQQSTVAL